MQLSALRAGPHGELVVRLFNPRGDEARATLRFARPLLSATAADLREGDDDLGNTGLDVIRTAAPPQTDGLSMTVRLAGYEIGTYLVRLA